MSFDSSQHAAILPAGPADHGQLLNWILSGNQQTTGDSQVVASILARAERGEVSLAGLFQANLGRQPTGAAWGQLLPGKLGVVWPIRLNELSMANDGMRLLAAVDQYLENQQVSLRISLPGTDRRPADEQQRQLLLASGYQLQTELISMTLPLAGIELSQHGSLQLLAAAGDEQLIGELTASEEDSQDIPELQGCRSPADVLATYRSEAAEDDLGWFVVEHEGSPVGCLLLAKDLAGNSCTLQYMGLRRECRGRGWGPRLLNFAIEWSCQRGADNLRLMVDGRNQAAIEVYRRGGMMDFERRELWTR